MSVPIVLQCGTDWWMQFAYADGSGNPIAVTSPKMEIRQSVIGAVSTGALLFSSQGGSPTITFTAPGVGLVKASIAGSATKNATPASGVWDCYAIDPGGLTVLLGSGTFEAVQNVTAL